ncbi:amylo-alpha-1,6-glucosidase [Methanolobus halotolerans]|uniref:Glycogen debranching protein n=1 Tax=Methanolobus halotolerans TaxID=2052935 RepID=A0A4E0QDS0_9EURY|nr:amylo-alpha-1,6-glucosidase [Methanolobus halotolerans]TGC11531.1 glycogen debranching protein [Methanolobus halotolerans]
MKNTTYTPGTGYGIKEELLSKEWIITNGLGGYASSTSLGMNTRKYHGLMIAAMNPPVQRRLLLSSLDEEIRIGEETYYLGVHKYPGNIHPHGYQYLENFTTEPVPSFNYNVRDISIEKKVFMVYGKNTTVIIYNINNPLNTQVRFRVFPLVNDRNIHHLTRADDISFDQQAAEKSTVLKNGQSTLYLSSDMWYTPQTYWYYDFEYDMELSRGYPYIEDNFNSGYFETSIGKGNSSVFIVASTEDTDLPDHFDIGYVRESLDREIGRRVKLVEQCDKDDAFFGRLVTAGDSFIVSRTSTGSKTVIAGYHWFADWGRDSMISLPGLTLVTGRFDVARDILSTFADNCREGLIPNVFPDNPNASPLYNTVDASLWFIHALGRYFDYTDDTEFINTMWNTVEAILARYREGTEFDIIMDEDCLISHGGQLTWMDAKVGDLEITPRKGKACEINALWYNALRYAEYMGERLGKDTVAFTKTAERARSSFEKKFWNREKECLYDTIPGPDNGSDEKDASVRSNQILAVSLPFTMLPRRMEKSIVDVVTRELLTPYGLRTLSPSDAKYIGNYQGDTLNRDRAYHNGTVWAWLLGPYITAYRKIKEYSEDSKTEMELLLESLRKHLDEAGIGTISEIFDGDAPHIPGGCISQAWSVAEISRIQAEEILYQSNVVKHQR